MQIILGTGHWRIEKPTLHLNLPRGAGCEIRRNAAINDVEHKHGFPFLALGRVDRRQDEIILVKQRNPCEVTRGVLRIECQLGQEALT